MAEPWTDDLAALGAETRTQLRSIAATRAAAFTAQTAQEHRMSFIKRRPFVAALVAAAVLAVAAPVAWAIGTRIFVTIDPDQPAPEIEHSIDQQLQAAGVKAEVGVDKSDGKLRVQIRSHDPGLGSGVEVQIQGAHGDEHALQLGIQVELHAELSHDQEQAMQQAIVAGESAADPADVDATAQAIRDALTAAGFHDATVTAAAGTITVAIGAPPT